MRATHPFLRATTPERADGQANLPLEPSWRQGRGVYGGAVAGALAREMSLCAAAQGDGDRPLRWISVHFCAPATERGELIAQTVRRGSSVTHVRGELRRDETVIAFASATFARPRPSAHSWRRATMPVVPAPSDVPRHTGAPAPTFASHFEFRFCHGPPPLSGADTPELGAWIRFAQPLLVDAPAALGILDAAPPAAMARFDALRPMATVALTCQIFEPLPLVGARDDDHYLLVVRSNVCRDGYAEEMGELWSVDGRLIAMCWQTIALLG